LTANTRAGKFSIGVAGIFPKGRLLRSSLLRRAERVVTAVQIIVNSTLSSSCKFKCRCDGSKKIGNFFPVQGSKGAHPIFHFPELSFQKILPRSRRPIPRIFTNVQNFSPGVPTLHANQAIFRAIGNRIRNAFEFDPWPFLERPSFFPYVQPI